MNKKLFYLVIVFSLALAACGKTETAAPVVEPTTYPAPEVVVEPTAYPAPETVVQEPTAYPAPEEVAAEPTAAQVQAPAGVAKTLRLPDLERQDGGGGDRQRLHPAELR